MCLALLYFMHKKNDFSFIFLFFFFMLGKISSIYNNV